METGMISVGDDIVLNLVNIESELHRLYARESGSKKTRASLFNLILYTNKEKSDAYLQKVVNSVVAKFPCRVLFITEDDSTPPTLTTSVATQSVTKDIFCEIIRITLHPSLSERVPSLVLPHVLPDLPIYLLWTEDPSIENVIFSSLEPFANRLIFDSEVSLDLQAFSKTILALKSHLHCQVSDLNWSAIAGWRKIIASFFQGKPISLEKIETLKITSYQSNGASCAYLQAWLASKLKWKFQNIQTQKNRTVISYDRANVVLEYIENPLDPFKLPSGTLLDVEIQSTYQKEHRIFKRDPSSRQIYCQYSNEKECQLPTTSLLPGALEGQEIIEEIFYSPLTPSYMEMLQTLSEIPWR